MGIRGWLAKRRRRAHKDDHGGFDARLYQNEGQKGARYDRAAAYGGRAAQTDSPYRKLAVTSTALLKAEPSWMDRVMGGKAVMEFYRAKEVRLQKVKPEEVGLEALLDARLAAVRRAATEEGDPIDEARAIHRLVASIHEMEYNGPRDKGWEVRRRARHHLAARVGPIADRYRQRNEREAALEAYRALGDTGVISTGQKNAYAQLLPESEESGWESLRLQLSCVEDRPQEFKELRDVLAERILIGEDTPDDEIRHRLPLVLRAISGKGGIEHLELSAGLGYLRSGKLEQAIRYLSRAHSSNGHDGGRTAFYLAQAHFRARQFHEASESFDAALAQGFPRSRVAAWQGLSLAKDQRWADAYETFRIAEQTLGAEVDSEFFVYWGRASFVMRAVEESETRFRQALSAAEREKTNGAQKNEWASAGYGLAVCLEHAGNRDEALRVLKDVFRREARFGPAAHLLGWLLESAGENENAIGCYRHAVKASPDDLTYVLSLAFALADARHADALPLLERVAERGKGGTEVVRLLMLGHMAAGDRIRGRLWLRKLMELAPGGQACEQWLARDYVTLATEAFNKKSFAEAVKFWRMVEGTLGDGGVVQERLALSLLCDASHRIRKGGERDLQPLWMQISQAHRLSPSRESAFLSAFALLMQGDYEGAHSGFVQLESSDSDRPEQRFLSTLARYLAGDETASDDLAALNALPGEADLNPLLAFLQIQVAAGRGDFVLAAKRIEAWVAMPGYVRSVGVGRGEINALVLTCLEKAKWKRPKITKLLEGQNAKEDGYWKAALTIARHHETMPSEPLDADRAKLEKCDAAYQEVVAELPELERAPVLAEYAGFLRYRVTVEIAAGVLGAALSLLDRLEALPVAQPPAVTRVREILMRRLANPSHEKAYALLHRSPEDAFRVWREMLDRDPNNEETLQHLACLRWSEGYDAACAGHLGEAVDLFAQGIEYYSWLYRRDSYWDSLLEKGRLLHTNPAPFDEAGFAEWRADALKGQVRILVDVATHAANQPDGESMKWAKAAVSAMRKCGAPRATIEALAEELADRFLDRDPTNLPDFGVSMARAEKVIAMDPDNIKALIFILKAHTSRAIDAVNEADAKHGNIAGRMGAAHTRAETLEAKMPAMNEEERRQTKNTLAAYWEELGTSWYLARNEGVGAINQRKIEMRAGLRAVRDCIHESERAFDHAIRFDPTIALKAEDKRSFQQAMLKDVNEKLG